MKGTPPRPSASDKAAVSAPGLPETTSTNLSIQTAPPLSASSFFFQVSADAVKDTHHYDNRKYQLLYIALGVIVSLAINALAVEASGMTTVYAIVFVFQGLLVLVLIAFIAAIQMYTRIWGDLRRSLDKVFMRRLDCEIDDATWARLTRDALAEAFDRNARNKKKRPWTYKLLDILF